MKVVAILALLFGLGAVGSSVYAMVETKPNHDSLDKELKANGPSTQFDEPLLRSYKQALGRECVGAWAGGLFALIFGFIAVKKRSKGLGVVAILLGLAGAGVTFLFMPQPLLL